MGALARLADLKIKIGTSETSADTRLFIALTQATAAAEGLVGRALLRQASITVYPTGPESRWLDLPVAPIESITSVKQRYGWDTSWDDSDILLTADTDYIADNEAGILIRPVGSLWYPEPQCIQVVYTGGYADLLLQVAGAIPDGQSAAPDDLQAGVIDFAIAIENHRRTAGVESVSFSAGGGMQLKGLEPPKTLVEACKRLRRYRV